MTGTKVTSRRNQASSFGVWATAFDQGDSARLSGSWKQRLARLGRSSHPTSRRTITAVLFLLFGVVATSLLRFDVERPARADEPLGLVGVATEVPVKLVEYLPVPTAQEERIQQALDKPREFDLAKQSLNSIIESIAADSEITILLDGDFDGPKSIAPKLKAVSLRSLLRLLELPYLVDNDVLMIGDQGLIDKTVTRVYPVADLVSPLRPAPPATFETQPAPAPKYDELVKLIESAIGEEAWEASGGPGRIVVAATSHSIVVTNTYMVQERVLDFLRTLRAARAANAPLQRASVSGSTSLAPPEIRGVGVNSNAGLIGGLKLDLPTPVTKSDTFTFQVGVQR
ncbi:MAG: hypothetical protein KF708_00480 [Pirellulales bacterium]|nr:hypothetical protein [Pirellulales bacterium]